MIPQGHEPIEHASQHLLGNRRLYVIPQGHEPIEHASQHLLGNHLNFLMAPQITSICTPRLEQKKHVTHNTCSQISHGEDPRIDLHTVRQSSCFSGFSYHKNSGSKEECIDYHRLNRIQTQSLRFHCIFLVQRSLVTAVSGSRICTNQASPHFDAKPSQSSDGGRVRDEKLATTCNNSDSAPPKGP